MEQFQSAKYILIRLISAPLVAFILLVFTSLPLGISDFGFRISGVNVDLSQKFPPAIAFQVLEDLDSEVSIAAESLGRKVIVKAGFPSIAPLHLDEIKIVFNLNSSKPLASVQAPIHTSRRSMELDFQEDDFTPIERRRLELAQRDHGLDLAIDDRTPRYEVSFRERMNQVIEDMKASNDFPNEKKAWVSSEKKNSKVNPGLKGHSLVGEIEFSKDGQLVMTDQHYLDIRRFEEGVSKEVGEVDLGSATFKMEIEQPKGMVIARLLNQRGGVEGEGIIPVKELLAAEKPRLVLRRRDGHYRVGVQSAQEKTDSFQRSSVRGDSKKPLKDSETKGPRNRVGQETQRDFQSMSFLGFYQDSSNSQDNNMVTEVPEVIDSGSEMMVEGFLDNHLSSIAAISMKETSRLNLLPRRALLGLQRILEEQEIPFHLEEGDSLIWGTVTQGGKPLAGAKVSVSGGQTIYWGGQLMPDTTRRETSVNGLFAIILKQSGWLALQVEPKVGAPFNVNGFVSPGKVTEIGAEVPSAPWPVTLRTFDALTGEPRPSWLAINTIPQDQPSYDLEVGSGGVEVLNMTLNSGIQFIKTQDTGEYEAMLMNYGFLEDYLHIPLVRKTWLSDLRRSLSLPIDDQTGVVVGFVQGDDYSLEFPNKADNYKILYFNSAGEVQKAPQAGGGFVIFDVKERATNVMITSKRKGQKIARILTPSPEFVQVLTAAFD